MPGIMSVAEFLHETKEDFNSPTTSTFAEKIALCRQTVASLEEGLDSDRESLLKMKKALKAIYNGGNVHIDNEMYLSRALEKLGANAINKDNETDIGAAFIKFSVVTKQLSELMKTFTQNVHNIIMFPVENILKSDLKGVKGDLKKPFDKALREYESKLNKLEKEKKQQAKEAGLVRNEVSPSETAEETDKERKLLQLQMCEFLIKVNEIKTKKGVELLSHLVDFHNAQTNYFQDGLKIIKDYHSYMSELSGKIQAIKQKQDEERRQLLEFRTILRSCSPNPDSSKESNTHNHYLSSSLPHHSGSSTVDRRESKAGYSLHQIQGNKNFGDYKLGYLLKKSGGKMKVKVWQKRKCEVKDGILYIYHSDESKSPTSVNLLTCQVKPVFDEKKCFDLVSYNRTYHFQAEDENECSIWISVLLNSKEGALKREFDSHSSTSPPYGNLFPRQSDGSIPYQSLNELRQSVINQILKLPGNDKCVDCNSSKDPTWLSTNFGVILCIECSGIHRELGVHISRIQSLTLDNIGTSQLLLARIMSNNGLNDIMEATLDPSCKLKPNSSMEERYEYIRAKYMEKKFALKSCNKDTNDLKDDLEEAILSRNIYRLLHVFVEGVNLNWILPSFEEEGLVSLHVAIQNEDGTSLHIVDFLVQNSADLNIKTHDGNTPLHLCVLNNQSECIKLLLRCGADPYLTNNGGKTALQLAKEKDLLYLIEMLEHALDHKKNLFENVNIDWRFPVNNEDVSTDFSDDEAVDEKAVPVYPPPPAFSSRPSSVTENESPSNRSENFKFSGNKKLGSFFHHSGSMKKKAPLVPQAKVASDSEQNNSPNKKGANKIPSIRAGRIFTHARTTSDTCAVMQTVNQWRNISAELENSFRNEASDKNSSNQKHKSSVGSTSSPFTSVQRPGCPPPPLPPHQKPKLPAVYSKQPQNLNLPEAFLNNGKSEDDNLTNSRDFPIPPPRKLRVDTPTGKWKRCLAIYDCEAERDDELTFKEGETILILNEKTDDEDWMEGMIEGDSERRGVFPCIFVQMLPD